MVVDADEPVSQSQYHDPSEERKRRIHVLKHDTSRLKAAPYLWTEEELRPCGTLGKGGPSKYNPKPGSGYIGLDVGSSSNYPFYTEDEKYPVRLAPDGIGVCNDWRETPKLTEEEKQIVKQKAYETGIPYGFQEKNRDPYADDPKFTLTVISELHEPHEYGSHVDEQGRHTGGPFTIEVSPRMTTYDVVNILKDVGGLLPGVVMLGYAGKRLDDKMRTLEKYGVAYWNKRFPDWPLIVRRFR